MFIILPITQVAHLQFQAYAFVRDFILGNNQTGLVTTSNGQNSVIGGVHTEYLKGILTVSEVYTGSYATDGTYTWPQASFEAWGSYMATRTAADVPVASASGDGVIPTSTTSGGIGNSSSRCQWIVVAMVIFTMTAAF